MPNGFHGKRKEWKRMTEPLKRLDRVLKQFATEQGLELLRDTRNWPERSFRWGYPIERLIQIYLMDEQRLTWSFWFCAVEDRADGRYWKRKFLREEVTIEEISDHLPELLREAHAQVTGWTAQDLRRAQPDH
jgi:hypothetical protein